MSVRKSNRRRRVLLRIAVSIVAVAAGWTSHADARGIPAHRSVRAMMAGAGANAQGVPSPAAGKVLGGFTSQGWPVVLAISNNSKGIVTAGAGLDMSCASGASFGVPDRWRNLPIGPNGVVHVSDSIGAQQGSGASITGGTDSLTGKFNRKRGTFAGVWQLHLTFSMPNGQTDTCDSGRVTFTVAL